jgi:anti-anti-sigma regulatory factor
MITSYVTPEESLLYLSLLGPLDEYAANDLVQEYYERHSPALERCVLDLSGADYADEDGLNVLHRLSLLAQVDEIDFAVLARGSPVADKIANGAARYWVRLARDGEIPFARAG